MNRLGGSTLLLMIGALLMAAPLLIREVRLGEIRHVLQERNGSVPAQGAPQEIDPIEMLRAEARLGRRGAVLTRAPEPETLAADRSQEPAAPAPPVRGAGFRIQLPSLGLDWAVMSDIGDAELALGPGHYPGTALPGTGGNLAIAGHRTHRGQPSYFYHLNRLAPGDPLIIQTAANSWVYEVEQLFITDAYNLSVLAATAEPTVTLTTCDPPGTEEYRLIVQAKLVS